MFHAKATATYIFMEAGLAFCRLWRPIITNSFFSRAVLEEQAIYALRKATLASLDAVGTMLEQRRCPARERLPTNFRQDRKTHSIGHIGHSSFRNASRAQAHRIEVHLDRTPMAPQPPACLQGSASSGWFACTLRSTSVLSASRVQSDPAPTRALFRSGAALPLNVLPRAVGATAVPYRDRASVDHCRRA